MNNEFEILDWNAVVTVGNHMPLLNHATFRTAEYIEKLKTSLPSNSTTYSLFSDGLECEVLIPNKAWRKGTIKVCLVFSPDKIENENLTQACDLDSLVNSTNCPLEEIRQTLHHSTQ